MTEFTQRTFDELPFVQRIARARAERIAACERMITYCQDHGDTAGAEYYRAKLAGETAA